MRILKLAFVMSTIFALFFGAQAAPPQFSAVRPHLYAIETDGKISFLFGTRHSKIDLSLLPGFVMTAFRSRAIIAKEIVETLEDGFPIPTPQTDTTAERELPKPSSRAEEALRKRGIPDYLFTSPWICSFYYTWEPGDGPTMDPAFEFLARKLKKPVVGLDEAEDLKFSAESSDQSNSQCDIEVATRVISVEELQAGDEKALRDYFSGNIDLIGLCDERCDERSLKWLPKIERLHNEKGVFAIFGVGHLTGPSGLLATLKSRGHRVFQIKNLEQLNYVLSHERGRSRGLP